MSNDLSLMTFSNLSFRTTASADQHNQWFMGRLGVQQRYAPARLAISRSLMDGTSPSDPSEDASGRVINGNDLFGSDLPLWIALLEEHAERPIASTKDLQRLVRAHWHRGMNLLRGEWQEQGEDFDKFLLLLAGRAGLHPGSGGLSNARLTGGGESGPKLVARPVSIRIGDPGTDLATKKPVDWISNAAGHAPHVAVMGGTNSGKTHSSLRLLAQIKRQTNCPIIFFDIAKGDIAHKRELIEPLNMRHISVPASPVPLNFLALNPDSKDEATDLAFTFRDSFERVEKLGANQKNILRDAVTEAIENSNIVTFEHIRDIVQRLCDERGTQAGKLDSVLADLCVGRPIFAPSVSPQDFFSKSWLIDLHQASETQQKLVVFLVLDAAKRYFMHLPDAPADAEGHRAYRAVIAIDEARRVLGFKHPSLSDLIRLVRSKGVAIWLMSQSPDDFDAEEDNFLENIGLAIAFRTAATSAKALRTILGGDIDLAALPSGVAATRLPGKSSFVRVQAWEPH